MRMPTKARSTAPVAVMLVAGTLLLSACSGDINSPTGLAPAAPSMAKVPSHFNPGQGNKKVLGPGETAVYVFTIDPRRDNVLDMGTQLLEMPANSVCGAGSGYGTGTWTKPCTPQTAPVTITATVIGTSTLPRVEFQPAMRRGCGTADSVARVSPEDRCALRTSVVGGCVRTARGCRLRRETGNVALGDYIPTEVPDLPENFVGARAVLRYQGRVVLGLVMAVRIARS